MTCSVDSFSTKMLSQIFRMNHHSSHLLQNSVFPLHNPILLRSNWRRKHLLNAIRVTVFFKLSIFKLSTMITMDPHDGTILLYLDFFEQMLSGFKSIRFFPKKKSLSVPGIVIYNNPNIFPPTKTIGSGGTHEIHM
jgi:hypothetical protein